MNICTYSFLRYNETKREITREKTTYIDAKMYKSHNMKTFTFMNAFYERKKEREINTNMK